MMRDGKLGIGLVGYGYWGPNLLRNYIACEQAEVKYVCDKDAKRLQKAKQACPSASITERIGDLLGDPEVDAVLIATPIPTHFKLARDAMMAGKHVFIEKPLAASSGEAERLHSMARSRGLTLMVGHTFEYSPPVVKIKELIESDELGKIYFVSSSRINLGLHHSDMSVIWDLAPHDFSILFNWLQEEPYRISAVGRSCVQSRVPDVAFINLSFESGTVAEVQVSWLSPIKLRRTILVGSKKMLLYDDTEPVEKVKVFDHGVTLREPTSFGEFQLSYRTGDIVSPQLNNQEPLLLEAQHFVDCVTSGRCPQTDGHSGVRVVRALERAEASLRCNTYLHPLFEQVEPDYVNPGSEQASLGFGAARTWRSRGNPDEPRRSA